jgi:hypothetical protein
LHKSPVLANKKGVHCITILNQSVKGVVNQFVVWLDRYIHNTVTIIRDQQQEYEMTMNINQSINQLHHTTHSPQSWTLAETWQSLAPSCGRETLLPTWHSGDDGGDTDGTLRVRRKRFFAGTLSQQFL